MSIPCEQSKREAFEAFKEYNRRDVETTNAFQVITIRYAKAIACFGLDQFSPDNKFQVIIMQSIHDYYFKDAS